MKKKTIIIVCVVIFILMLLPFRVYHVKDGGSIEYKAILYSITKVKTLSNCETTHYSKGWRIKILGKEVIDLVDYIACDKDN